jgi:hypothetical protein
VIVTETLQLESALQLPDPPRLLVEWAPRWQDFKTSIRPAFARSGRRLAGEAPLGLYHYRGMIAAFFLQAFLLFVFIVIPREIDRMRPYAPPRLAQEDIIYYSGDELPKTEDLGGAESGATGRAGGRQAHHRSQTIKVARGASLAQQVVDAPNLKLAPSSSAVANLLALRSATKTLPGPPPAEGLHSAQRAPALPQNVVAPAPEVSSGESRSAPALAEAIVPPAPSVPSAHPLYAPRLESSVIAPAPNVSRDRNRAAPAFNPTVISPASTRVEREQARTAPALNGAIIAPAPNTIEHEVAPSRVQMNAAVVPPPVSSPERESSRAAKLTMPSPSVVAPPPSADAHDLRRLESGRLQSASPNVVPPPPTQVANGSFLSSVVGKLFGAQSVVPPPPSVSSSAAGSSRNPSGGSGESLASSVIPPPPSLGGSNTSGGASKGFRQGQGGADVIPPPPSVTATNSGSGSGGRNPGASLGAGSVVPPPPSISGSGSGNGTSRSLNGSGNGTLIAGNIVPPPPSVGSGSGLSGTGRTGIGNGGPGDIGSALAPPKGSSSSGENSAVVLSPDPGSATGRPGTGGKGSLALSPSGGEQPGLGGSGAGSSIGNGNGNGSGFTGEGSGAGKSGSEHGSDPTAHGGISPTPGSGGAGSAPTGIPAAPGVDIRGGSTIVTLPSFDSGNSDSPTLPGRSSVKGDRGPAITIVATSRSGGAFDFYGKLPGDNYTVYVDTNIGTVVMQFAETDPYAHHIAAALVGPQGLRTALPKNLPHVRVVIKCRLDSYGNLRDIQVVEAGPPDMIYKITAALHNWKFRPAMRGTLPVEVNALLGFNINTDDRN